MPYGVTKGLAESTGKRVGGPRARVDQAEAVGAPKRDLAVTGPRRPEVATAEGDVVVADRGAAADMVDLDDPCAGERGLS